MFSFSFFWRLALGFALKNINCCFPLLAQRKSGFPALQSKAVASKVLTCWLAHRSLAFAQRPDASQADRMMSTCIYQYFKILTVMDGANFIMTENEAVEFHAAALKHLKCYVWMHQHGMTCQQHFAGRRCFLLLPKLHFLWHQAWDVLATRVNPKNALLLSAESFMGEIGRVARSCHRSTVSKRTLDRWRTKFALRLDALAKELRANNSVGTQAR